MRHRKGTPVTINGTAYISIREAARGTGIDLNELRRRIKARWPEEDLGLPQINRRKIKVQCVETGKIYPSLTAAEDDVYLSHGTICNVLAGRYDTAAGLHWKKVEE